MRGERLVNISFTKLPGCVGCEVCLDGSNPQNLVLVDDNGDPVNVVPSCSPSIRPVPNVTIDVPASRKVNTDCDANTALVTGAAPSSDGGCAGTTINCSGVHVDSNTDLTGIAMTGGNLPIGTSMFSCSGSSDSGCSGSAGDSWTIEVNDQTTLDVVVQLSPMIAKSEGWGTRTNQVTIRVPNLRRGGPPARPARFFRFFSNGT